MSFLARIFRRKPAALPEPIIQPRTGYAVRNGTGSGAPVKSESPVAPTNLLGSLVTRIQSATSTAEERVLLLSKDADISTTTRLKREYRRLQGILKFAQSQQKAFLEEESGVPQGRPPKKEASTVIAGKVAGIAALVNAGAGVYYPTGSDEDVRYSLGVGITGVRRKVDGVLTEIPLADLCWLPLGDDTPVEVDPMVAEFKSVKPVLRKKAHKK